MKVLKIAMPVLALALSLCSCEKQIHEQTSFLKEGDLDEPIIVGLGLNASQQPVYPGEVKLYDGSSSSLLDSVETSSQGGFQFEVDEGSYFLKLFDRNEVLVATTETIDVTDSTYIVISP